MTTSTNLGLPYLAGGQAQKHVTVNEGLRRLDAIVQITVESATTTAQPGSPADGEVWIVPAGKTGDQWGPMANGSLGYFRDGAWEQITPREGWLAFVRDTDQLLVYSGSVWSVSALRTALGLGTAATHNTGASGGNVPLLNVANTWNQAQTFSGFPGMAINGAAGSARDFHFTTAGLRRFEFRVNNLSESGGNAGSNFQFSRRADDGSALGDVFTVTRSTGAIDFAGPLRRASNAVFDAGAHAVPAADNTWNLGNGSFRFGTVYAATGSINTSDAREKTALRALNAAEVSAVRRVMAGVGVFQWLGALAAKGEDPAQGGARLHIGVTAQAVREAFAAEGLDAAHYALFCADPVIETVEVAPARIERVTHTGPDGEEIAETIDIPAVTDMRPVIDPETGEQLVRLGVRHDQLFAMALAVLFAGQG